MKLKTRLLSGLLALILVFSLIPMSSTAADDNNSYTVVINYMFENGEIAAQSYSGLFAGGSDYGAAVDVPVVVGYAPTAPVGYDSDAIDVNFTTSQLTCSFTNIQQNITLNVIYVPAEVNYVVKHYLQNVDDDNYAAPIKNVSGKDFAGGRVFYKSVSGGAYLGGITYMASIPSLAANEEISLYAGHYTTGSSELMFVTYAE